MEKIINIRDLGGIPLSGGRQITRGVFYRSSALDKASEKDIAELQSYDLKTIFDFRDATEKISDKVYSCLDAEYTNIPIMIDSARIVKMQAEHSLKSLKGLCMEDMRIAYRNMAFGNASYKELFKRIVDGKTPLLFHCTAGKDRTGIFAALLCILLGASREDALNDYLKTNQVMPLVIEDAGSRMPFFIRRFLTKRLNPVIIIDESYLNAALDEILSRYGSFSSYFEKEYGVTAEDAEKLRERYSIPSEG